MSDVNNPRWAKGSDKYEPLADTPAMGTQPEPPTSYPAIACPFCDENRELVRAVEKERDAAKAAAQHAEMVERHTAAVLRIAEREYKAQLKVKQAEIVRLRLGIFADSDLGHCAATLAKYARVLQGNEEDLTGHGLFQIFCEQLERATGCKVLTAD